MQKERCLLDCLKENKKVVNKKRRHPELDSGSHLVSVLERGEIPNHCHQTPDKDLPGRGQAVKAAVWNDNIFYCFGFTLIELLVVVLIIGILAAVAVPQYQNAVWKSRNAELKTLVSKVSQAEKVYYMANGNYTDNFNELDIDIPLAAPGTHEGQNISPCSIAVQGTDSVRKNDRIQLILGRTNTENFPRISARYITGKYKCTGFSQLASSDNLMCTERNAYATISRGDFCVKLEHATLYSRGTGTNSDFYTLP